MQRWDIINHLIKKYNFKSYLEIGYYKGWSFDNVKCDNKTAVDPNPCKTPEQEAWIYENHNGTRIKEISDKGLIDRFESISKMTSDKFFELFNPDNWTNPILGKNPAFYDIIFIDGLHEAKQVTRDIENSLKHLSEGGVIVLHDCNPPTLEHTTTGDIHGNWNGDVYKAFIQFRYQYPEYTTYTIDADWGCGVIRGNPTDDKSFLVDNLYQGTPVSELLEDWNYFDSNRKAILGIVSIPEFLEKEKIDG